MPKNDSAPDGKVLPILLAAVAVALLLALALVLRGGDFAKLERFPSAEFLEGPGDFLGNEYRLQAQIDAQLKYDKAIGRLLAVVPDGERSRLPVFVPVETGGNLHVGQRYEMRIRVDEGGLIYVEDLRKF